LLDFNYQIVGSFTNVSDALSAAQNEAVDVALRDVNLRREKVFPAAKELTKRVFRSYSCPDPAEERSRAITRSGACACSKPFNANDLTKMLIERMEGSG
jgi:hypothetical protein